MLKLLPILAGIDGLIGLIVFLAISILATWLQKKQRQGGEDEDEATMPPRPARRPGMGGPPPVTSPPRPAPSWEEELKRLLEGRAAEPPPPSPAPPPIIVPAPRPAPPPLVSIPEEFSDSTYGREHSPVEVTFKPLPTLPESVHAIQEATSLEQKVQQHRREATEKPVQMTKVEHKAFTREAVEVRAMVRNPKSLRSALVASVILGPPRALAD